MNSITIKTYLPVDRALELGLTVHGGIPVTPTAEHLAELTPEERVVLARYAADGSHDPSLHVNETGWPGVVTALRDMMARSAAEEAKRLANVKREIDGYARILAAPAQYAPGLPLKPVVFPGCWDSSPNYSRDNADAKALWAQVEERRATERRAIITDADAALGVDGEHVVFRDGAWNTDGVTQAVIAAARAYRDHKWVDDPEIPVARSVEAEALRRNREATEKLEAKWRAAAAHYAERHLPEYSRALVDGRDMTKIAARHVEDRLLVLGDVTWTGGDERPCPVPSNEAYAVRDELARVVAGELADAGALAEVVEVGVTRLDTCKRRCDSGWRVCAVARVAVCGDEVLVYRLAEEGHDHEEYERE